MAAIGVDHRGVREHRSSHALARHFIEHLAALVEQSFAAEKTDHDRVYVLVRFAPDLSLHVLEETKRPLPISALRELLEHEREVVQRHLVLEHLQAPRDASARREAAQLVD